MNILKIKDPQGNWVDIPALKGDKGDKGDPGISPTIDSTLSQANQAADAKAVGDKIDEIALTIDETLTQSGQVADAKMTGDALNTKADQNGYYENLNVGVADQLASKNYIEDNEPYTFRPTANGAKVGTREFDTIVGGSIVWNQKMPKGTAGSAYSASSWNCYNNGDGSLTIEVTGETGSATTANNTRSIPAASFTIGHKYIWLGSKSGIRVDLKNSNIFSDTVFDCTKSEYSNVALIFTDLPQGSYKIYPMLIDLTQMFGSEIADYIYNLEQATPGAGVAWFRKYFPKDYYEYNLGELMYVNGVQSHDMVGFNLWDEKWEAGQYLTTNGTKTTAAGTRCKNPISIIGGVDYYFHCTSRTGSGNFGICWYDSNDSFINSNVNYGKTTAPVNAKYLRFFVPNTWYGSVYKNDICVNLSGTRNGEYEPYTKHSYPLDPSLTLKGIPKLVDGKLAFDGDAYRSDGTVERRYGIVDLGTFNWGMPDADNHIFRMTLLPNHKITNTINYICSNYFCVNSSLAASTMPDKSCKSNDASAGYFYIKDTAYNDTETFKAAMSGVYLVYELAEPATETAQPYQSPQIIDPYGTEEYVTTSLIPIGHQTQYPEDLRAKIDSLPWDFANLIAPVEVTYIATQNYTAGSLFIVDNILYKATTNIANGGTITPNTNCTATTLAEIIAAL